MAIQMNEFRIYSDRLRIDEMTTASLDKIGVVIGHGDVVCTFPIHSIPNGWSFQSNEDDGYSYFIDERGNKRVRMWDMSDEFSGCDIDFRVLTRYHISSQIYCDFGVDDRVSGKTIYLPTIDEISNGADGFQCSMDWLNEHYPDWENPAAYWEDE